MRPNTFLSHLQNGRNVIGAWLSMPSSVAAEAVAANDFDYVCTDLQHGLIHYSDLVPMLQALTIGPATPIVRVPQNQPAFIGKALDAGAMGVIVPMVNSADEARQAVAACRYAPDGSRSYGPTRAGAVEGADYYDRANTEVTCIPMIETVEAMTAIDEILEVPGVDVIYVGPNDLSISLGVPPNTNDARLLDAMDEIVAGCRRHDVVPGIHANARTARDRFSRGFRMVTVTADLVALRAKVGDDLATVRAGLTGSDDALY